MDNISKKFKSPKITSEGIENLIRPFQRNHKSCRHWAQTMLSMKPTNNFKEQRISVLLNGSRTESGEKLPFFIFPIIILIPKSDGRV